MCHQLAINLEWTIIVLDDFFAFLVRAKVEQSITYDLLLSYKESVLKNTF